jgi:deoxycitidine kinase/deoxyguanosine kinase
MDISPVLFSTSTQSLSTPSLVKKTPIIVSLEGNIGAGKTTLLSELEKRYFGKKEILFLREPVDEWAKIKDNDGATILSKFYADPKTYSFAFQIMAYSTRLHALRKIVADNPECKIIICERSLDADKHVFAKMLHDEGTIESVMYQIYERYFGLYETMFQLNAVIYVNTDAEICFQRISKRAREGESTIPIEYLNSCRSYHQTWLLSTDMPVLHLDTNAEATFDGCNDPGTRWLNQIDEFLLQWSN